MLRQETLLRSMVVAMVRKKSKIKEIILKKCGQSFWSFISGNEQLYTTIIEPLGHTAKERNEDFAVEYGKVITRFTAEFTQTFCQPDGTILWEKLVQFNSAAKLKS